MSAIILSPEQLATRTDGIHVSTLIRRISASLGKPEGKRANNFTEADLDQFAFIGRLWEAQLAASMYPAPRYERLGEMEVDGIIGSPDVYDQEERRVGEIKATWTSAKRPIEEKRAYFWQVMAYCYMLDTRLAWLDVFYVNGNYSPPVPQARHYDLEFAWAEIKDNWAMLLRNVDGVHQ